MTITGRDDEFKVTIQVKFNQWLGHDPNDSQMTAFLYACKNGLTGEGIDDILSKEPESIAYRNTPKVRHLPRIRVAGRDFITSTGQRHQVKGSTELMLAWRYAIEGPDAIRPALAQRRQIGFNNLRVLWQKDVGNVGNPWMMPLSLMGPFLALAEEYGFYVQGTILADCGVVNPYEADQRGRVADQRAATSGINNLIEQLGNEYDKNQHDPRHFPQPTDRLSANSSSTEGGKDAPYWDFFCFSGQRSPLNHAIREYGPVEFIYSEGNWGGVPAICDEGMKPGLNSNDPRDYERAGAQARSGNGGRFHTAAGTSGNSCLFDSLEEACAISFIKGLGE